ncbi:MAG: GNAT family N-acetyltransferase [Desulfobacterales bacterium]
MISRSYTGEADLKLLQNFNAAAIRATDHCGYLHPGDIPHHIYNGNKYFDPAEVMTLWEDDRGVAAWMLANPRYKGFDVQVRPDLRGEDLEREILEYGYERTADLMQRHNIVSDTIFVEAFQEDMIRVELLTALDWELDNESSYILNRVEINSMDVPALSDGYSFRSAKGIEDAAALAGVHSAAFGSEWTPELYRQVMQSPGYEPERELVIQAPDGRFVAFSIIWYDHMNRIGLFEPVGTHKDHRRRGFGRAIVLYGLQKMAASGMEFATVAHSGNNEAARGLYQSCGFRPWHLMDGYKKCLR